MFSKKSLRITLAFVLLIGLASLGLAYGYWTDALNINGTVTNGELSVEFTNMWWSDNNCTYNMDATNHNFTITANNAYPGFWCEASVEVKNTGTIPVKVLLPVVSQTGPDYWDIYPYYVTSIELAPGQTAAGVEVEFLVPTSETGNEGATSTVSVLMNAVQVNAP